MRIVMMGTGTFAEPTFQALLAAGETVVGLVTQPDRATGRAGSATRQTTAGLGALADAERVPIIRPERINAPEGLVQLQALEPELLVVAAYGQILAPAVIAVPRLGAVNVHASLLPKFRGAAPVAHAILAGETETGVTIIQITPGLDDGNMLAQERTTIAPHETTGELEARLAQIGARLCADVVRQLKSGPLAGVPQDSALVTKAPKFRKEFGQIDWRQPAVQVARHVRAMQPWPGAYTFLEIPGKPALRVLIRRAEDAAGTGEPGGVLGTAPLTVACGSGAIEVHEVQPAGGRAMPAEDWARGQRLTVGARFGNPS